MENRFKDDMGNDCLMTVDGTDCPINEPKPFNKAYYSHKMNGLALRYEVGVSILCGDICWVHGPFRAGANSDVSVLKDFVDILIQAYALIM